MNLRALLVWISLGLMVMGFAHPAVAAKDLAREIMNASVKHEGFLNLYFNQGAGDLYIDLKRLDQDFLLVTSLPQGLGSNDVGLDRGQLGYTRMVRLERHGPYVILKQLNTQYLATSDNRAEQKAAQMAFADSILWKGKVIPGKQALVKINGLVLQDLHGVADSLAYRQQGAFTLNLNKSLILPKRIKSFPNNSDIDLELTYSSNKPGDFIKQVVPEPKHISLRVRNSFIALPEPGYAAKAFSPKSGYLYESYLDFATAIDTDIEKRRLLRHRLIKTTPGEEPSTVVEPIVYYLDPGVPEPIRTALLQGASWWTDAFAEAGFIDAFRVEMLPQNADPQDIRFNTINWVHRATRGWSYGAVVTDPRTGEIIKGHVTLGSQRVRQDHIIARGLTASWPDREAAKEASEALALARIRQLAAHELGHTLGLDHNFAASSDSNASVMDYPHPFVRLAGEHIAIDNPYREGLGEWDKYAIKLGYSDQAVAKTELKFIGEADSRNIGASHVHASLWDRGNNAITELVRLNKVRRFAIDNFSVQAMLDDEPQGELSDSFVPIYLLTRYQIQAAAKWVGGTEYSYTGKGSSLDWHYVAPEKQLLALDALLKTLEPDYLIIPESLLTQLVPKAGGYQSTTESFASSLGVLTDPLALVENASRISLNSLLHPMRLNRVFQAHMLDSEQLSVIDLVDRLIGKTLYADPPKGAKREIWMRVNAVVLDELAQAYHNKDLMPETKAMLLARLNAVLAQLKRKAKRESDYLSAHFAWLKRELSEALVKPEHRVMTNPLPIPPGSPI